ncbi:MAM and LDL-receptor class A domain-containing protein 1-like [Dreissena polymorpha]|nr:MAM and LDL-receptor class A domain-containing protein 1-like [Dreissena polymorpha]XP_052219112.1 MAM and LDL-receptor class A domain-containing protein 1-like [Dreissena polymorpha]
MPCKVWNCTFDNDNLCNWTNVNWSEDNLNWNLIHSTTPTDKTEPSNDHTTGNIDGAYIFLKSSAPTVQGDNAMLQSPEINTTGSLGICLNCWYSTNGDSIGSLKVYIEEAGFRRLIWSLSGHQGTEWRNASVPLHSNQKVHIILEATVGDGFLGDIALDDISMTCGPCQLEPSNARPISLIIVG